MKSLSLFGVPQTIATVFILLFAAGAQQSTDKDNHGIVVSDMDRSVKPGNNFYKYAKLGKMGRPSIQASPDLE